MRGVAFCFGHRLERDVIVRSPSHTQVIDGGTVEESQQDGMLDRIASRLVPRLRGMAGMAELGDAHLWNVSLMHHSAVRIWDVLVTASCFR